MLNTFYTKKTLKSQKIQNSIFSSLNHKQSEAIQIDSFECILLIASPGTGKTMTLSAKICQLIERNLPPERILAITFTRKAAQEMNNRVLHDLNLLQNSTSVDSLTICNFHQISLRILRENYRKLGFDRPFVVLGPYEQRKTVAKSLRKLGIKEKSISNIGPMVQETIDDALIQQTLSNSEFMSDFSTHSFFGYKVRTIDQVISAMRCCRRGDTVRKNESIFELYKEYKKALKDLCAIDFDDMVPLVLELFKRDSEVKRFWQEKFKFILCDEFQDVSGEQFELLRILCEGNRKIFVCGDEDQAIFGWRGGTWRFFESLQTRFKSQTVVLEQNYRSTKNIVKAFTSLIQKNEKRLIKKSTWTDNGPGKRVIHMICNDFISECKMISESIQKLNSNEKIPFEKMAVLSRTKGSLNDLNLFLKKRSIPVIKVDGDQKANFFPMKKVETFNLITHLEFLLNFDNNEAFLRLTSRKKPLIGKIALEKLQKYAKYKKVSLFRATQDCSFYKTHLFNKKTCSNLVEFVMRFKKLRRDVLHRKTIPESIERLILFLRGDKDSPKMEFFQDFVEKITQSFVISKTKSLREQLLELIDFVRSDVGATIRGDNGVHLSTVHQAKGLQWEVVFIKTFNEGHFPMVGYNRINSHNEQNVSGDFSFSPLEVLEEERKVLYVGISRATKQLYLSSVLKDENGTQMLPSRYLQEINNQCLDSIK